MRVCLINPPRIHPKVWGQPTVYQPLSIAYVAAVLEKEHKVCIIDAPTEGWKQTQDIDETNCKVGLTNKQIAEKINQISPDVAGVSIPFSGWSKAAFEVASVIKQVDKDITTVLDGLHPSARPAECLANPNVDFVVRGEPEYSTLELVNALEKGATNEELKKIQGIGFTENKNPVITAARPEIQDLDALPFPARHLLPMETYFEAVKENPIRGVIRDHYAIMITSRGCPHKCIFCSNHIVMGKKWRGRNPESVVDEIEHLVKIYKIKQIDFFDDNMTRIKKRAEKICDLIVERNLNIKWFVPTGVRADTIDEQLLRKMKRSGCKGIRFAPESGVQQVITDIIGKNLKLEQVERAVVLAKKVGIKTAIFFILGLPGETKEDMEQTIKFAYKLRKLGAQKFHFSIATPIYGTELYRQAVEKGFLLDGFSDEALARAEPLMETPEFTPQELQEICLRANAINQNITAGKVFKLMKNPKQAMSIAKALLTKPKPKK